MAHDPDDDPDDEGGPPGEQAPLIVPAGTLPLDEELVLVARWLRRSAGEAPAIPAPWPAPCAT